jgi:alcohol dehydrogenase
LAEAAPRRHAPNGRDSVGQEFNRPPRQLLTRKLEVPVEPFVYGIGDKRILTTLCPGGKERMRTLMELVRHGRLDLAPLITHRFGLDAIEAAYDLFANQRDGVVKVAITP